MEVEPKLSHSHVVIFPSELSFTCISVSNHVAGFLESMKSAVGNGVTSTIFETAPV